MTNNPDRTATLTIDLFEGEDAHTTLRRALLAAMDEMEIRGPEAGDTMAARLDGQIRGHIAIESLNETDPLAEERKIGRRLISAAQANGYRYMAIVDEEGDTFCVCSIETDDPITEMNRAIGGLEIFRAVFRYRPSSVSETDPVPSFCTTLIPGNGEDFISDYSHHLDHGDLVDLIIQRAQGNE